MNPSRVVSLPHLRSVLLVVASFIAGSTFAQGRRHVGGLPLPQPGEYLTYTVENDFTLPRGERLSRRVDLSSHFPTPGNQGPYASCTAWAIGYGLMTYEYNLEYGIRPPAGMTPPDHSVYSPGYLFGMVKQYAQPERGRDACEHGVDIAATFTVACQWGNVPVSVCGYEGAGAECRTRITPDIMDSALFRKLRTPVELYHKCDTCTTTEGPFHPEQWQFHLEQGQPILVWLYIDCTFEEQGYAAHEAGEPFVWDHPIYTDDDCAGGHALLCCGYDRTDSTFLFYNSFGTEWGDDGYCRMTYRTLYRNCLKAFVFTGEFDRHVEPRTTPHGRAPEVTTEEATTRIRPGQHMTTEGLMLRFTAHHRRRGLAVVKLVDPATDQVLRTVVMNDQVGSSFIHAEKLWTVRFAQRRGLFRFGHRVGLSVVVDDDEDLKLKQEIDKHLQRFQPD